MKFHEVPLTALPPKGHWSMGGDKIVDCRHRDPPQRGAVPMAGRDTSLVSELAQLQHLNQVQHQFHA